MLETYTWALVPAQPDPTGPVRIEDERVQGQGPLAARVSRKLKELGLLTTRLAAAPLRLELDRYLWRDRDRLELKTLWGYLASYLYLPRLVNSDVLLDAVRDGLASLTWNPETFAYAQRHDPDAGRYVGLVAGQQAQVVLDDYSVIVKPEVAQRQLAEVVQPHPIGGGGVRPTGTGTGTGTATGGETPPVGGSGAAGPGVGPTPAAGPALAHRFYGAVELNPLRIGRDAGEIAQEVVQHLCTLPGATVRVRLEIEVEAPGGVPEDVVRTVSENSRVLNFATHEFEDYAATGEGQPHAADTGAESPHTPAVAAPQGRRTEE